MATALAGFFDWKTGKNNLNEYVSAEVPYFVFSCTDEQEALTTTIATAPTTFEGLPYDACDISERINTTTWKTTVTYKSKNPSGGSGSTLPLPTFSFDITAGTEHRTLSKDTVYSAGFTGPDYGCGVGFDGEKFEGYDVFVPKHTFSETHYYSPDDVTFTFHANLAALACTVNNAEFRDFAAGEVLFMNATGNRRGTTADDLWEVSYNFAVSKNRTNVVVGSFTIPTVKGWEYVWARYKKFIDTARVVATPYEVLVEQIYDYTDFGLLDLGETWENVFSPFDV
jgi:hypothetical protein